MVPVRARHPARTFGDEKEKSDEALEDDELFDDEPVDGGFCFTTWRRSSRATWGGILLAIVNCRTVR